MSNYFILSIIFIFSLIHSGCEINDIPDSDNRIFLIHSNEKATRINNKLIQIKSRLYINSTINDKNRQNVTIFLRIGRFI